MAGVSHRLWLLDIREEIAGIKAVTAETDFAGFAASWAMKRAVEHGLLLIAEAAKHIPAELKGAHADVPWRKIHGLGNLLRHEYRRSDPENPLVDCDRTLGCLGQRCGSSAPDA